MSEIRILTEEEIKLISAGEVVERPSSIVKELVENSIDAKSKNISLNIFDGGLSEIEILDDGLGMSISDLEKAILPHATSKLPSVKDLYNGINTFGFRGEALSAIVSIGNTSIISKKNNFDAYELKLEFGKLISKNITAFDLGTKIKISNIFDAIPARKKFLKTKETEWNAIENTLIGMTLTSPEIKFSIKSNNNSVIELPIVNNIIERAYNLVPPKYFDYMIPIDYNDGYVSIKGLISGIEYGYYDRSKIHVCVNKRAIKQYKITQAIIKGYEGETFGKRYPMAYLSIEVPANEVDVNVHPRKEEVAFNFPKRIENIITKAIIQTLENRTKYEIFNANKSLEINENTANKESIFEKKESILNSISNPINNNNFIEKSISINQPIASDFIKNSFSEKISSPTNYKNNIFPSEKIKYENLEIKNFEIKKDENNFLIENKYLGTFAKTYLLFMKNDSILLIDQHAIHERIIYESIKSQAEEHLQSLMEPLVCIYDEKIIKILEKNLDLIKKCGLEIGIFNKTTALIRASSKAVKNLGLKNVLDEIIVDLKEINTISSIEDLRRNLLANIACKKAIKAGEDLNNEQISLLLSRAKDYEIVSLCPHGRPTYYKLHKNMIDTLFKRK